MLIRLIGFILAATGAALSFGAYKAFSLGQVETITAILIPSVQLSAGLGVFFLRNPARYFAFMVCCFYAMLGVLSLRGVASPIDFVPFVPLIEYIPSLVLNLDHEMISIVCFFVLPVLAALFLTSPKIAQGFDFELKGLYSWHAPILVMIASGFITSSALINLSRIDQFIHPESRVLFGFSLSASQNQILLGVEFMTPILIGFGLTFAQKWAWSSALLMAGSYWFPFIQKGLGAADFSDFSFLFFGTSWAIVVLTLLIHLRFFFQHDAWVERREAKGRDLVPGHAEWASTVSGASIPFPGAPPPASTMHQEKKKKHFSIVPILFVLAAVGGMLFYLNTQRSFLEKLTSLVSKKSDGITETPVERKSKPNSGLKSAPKFSRGSIQETPASPEASPELLRLEGVSVDAQGSYAIINDQVIQVGGEIDGFLVETIEPHRVLLSKDGEKKWLSR